MCKWIKVSVWGSLLFIAGACSVRQSHIKSLAELRDGEVSHAGDSIYIIPAPIQYPGEAYKGKAYLFYSNYVSAGIPLSLFKILYPSARQNLLARSGKSARLPASFNYITSGQSEMAAPNCFTCHAGMLNDKFIIGLGNRQANFTAGTRMVLPVLHTMFRLSGTYKRNPGFRELMHKGLAMGPQLQTLAPGVNLADKLTMLLLEKRNPQNMRWQKDSSYFTPGKAVVPVDVPAWWLLKKKNAMFYNGYGRGDFRKFLMGSNLLTMSDTLEAREVFSHFNDVLAYLYSLKPPAYPIKPELAKVSAGKQIFTTHCQKCHGSYGEQGIYPNKLIPARIVKTDSLLWKNNYLYPGYINWFNSSWLSTAGGVYSTLQPFPGYIAPPLDGIWATAPYLHNGSVPTLYSLLNSKKRPVRWQTNTVNGESYNVSAPGIHFREVKKGSRKVYDTSIPGYGNGGHTFGDKLEEGERLSLIAYLKTL